MAILARNGPFQHDHARPSPADALSGPAATAPTDATLVSLAQRDPLAFAPLYQRYVTPVYRYCYRQTSDPDAASDLTAHIFTKALESLPRFRVRNAATADATTGGTFRSWLFAIAHNAIVDRRRRQRPTVPFDRSHELAIDTDAGPEARAVHQDELGHLIAVLHRLPDTHRTIIELRLAGLTTAEIGETLGMSRAAVKSAQTRAYARLRALLAPDDHDRNHDHDHSDDLPSHAAQESPR
ncbi:MAG TPA: sigma-70 family RNA polymerase sigma factor [Thermomicrobiales bacterium]|nr:sigma-70 family RNA polymerase sigma factor [Thermomicrobiales bacterium]